MLPGSTDRKFLKFLTVSTERLSLASVSHVPHICPVFPPPCTRSARSLQETFVVLLWSPQGDEICLEEQVTPPGQVEGPLWLPFILPLLWCLSPRHADTVVQPAHPAPGSSSRCKTSRQQEDFCPQTHPDTVWKGEKV